MKLLPAWERHSPDDDISVYIFTSACQMVGLCLAVIGILSTDPNFRDRLLPRDYLLVGDTMIFLVTILVSYLAMRTRKSNRLYKLEILAEVSFGVGMALMVLICLFLSLEMV